MDPRTLAGSVPAHAAGWRPSQLGLPMPQVLTDQLHTLFMIIEGGHEEYAKENEFKKNLHEGRSFEAEDEDYRMRVFALRSDPLRMEMFCRHPKDEMRQWTLQEITYRPVINNQESEKERDFALRSDPPRMEMFCRHSKDEMRQWTLQEINYRPVINNQESEKERVFALRSDPPRMEMFCRHSKDEMRQWALQEITCRLVIYNQESEKERVSALRSGPWRMEMFCRHSKDEILCLALGPLANGDVLPPLRGRESHQKALDVLKFMKGA